MKILLFCLFTILISRTSMAADNLATLLGTLNQGQMTVGDMSCSQDYDGLAACEVLNQKKHDLLLLKNCYSAIIKQTTAMMKKDPLCNFNENFRALNAAKLRDEDAEQVVNCNHALKQALLCNLNEKEQEFAASILVTWGEARGATGNYFSEYHGVRKVMENRARLINENSNKGNQVNILHVALQDNQFSLFNVDDRNWLIALDPAMPSSDYISKSLKAYQDFPSSQCSPQAECDKIISYHARWMKQETVRWAQDDEGNNLPFATFKFNGIYQSSASTNKNSSLPKAEQNRRHWFYTYDDPDAEVRGIDPQILYKANMNRCDAAI